MLGDREKSQAMELLAILPIERQGPWLDACLLSGGGHSIRIEQVSDAHAAAARLRHNDQAILVLWHEGTLHDPLAIWDQLQDVTATEGFLVLGVHVQEGWHERYIDAGAIACLDMDHIDALTLVHSIETAIELESLRRQDRELQAERNRARQRETRDIDRALNGQRLLLERLESLGGSPVTSSVSMTQHADAYESHDPLSDPAGERYCEALKAFLFDESGSGSQLAKLLAMHFLATRAPGNSIMRLHLAAVNRITAHAGPGSLKHCLSGADRFLMELLLRMHDSQMESLDQVGAVPGQGPVRSSPLVAA